MAENNQPTPAGAAKKFFTLLRLEKKDISTIYVYAILAGLVNFATPLGIQTIISFVLAGSLSTSIIVLIVMVVVAVFIGGLLQVRQMQVIEKIQQKIFVRYSLEFANRLPKLDIEKMSSYYLPELVNRFFDTASLQKGIEKLLLDIPSAVIQILFGVVLLSLYHPVFIGFGVVLLVLLYFILRNTLPTGFAANVESSDYKYKTAAWLEEMARVVKTFKYSKGTSLNIEKADGYISNYLDSHTIYFKILVTQFWSLIGFKVIITASMLIVGSILLVDQQINIGQFIAADIVIIMVIGSVEKLITNLDKIYDVLTAVEKLSKITDCEIEKDGTQKIADLHKGIELEFRNLEYSYDFGNPVLKDINFTVEPGKTICIYGNSGSGKTTILRLLTGAYKSFKGSLFVDAISINNYNLESLRSVTGILLTQQDIFQGTLLENITMGNKSYDEVELKSLVELCGLTKFVQSLPKGFDTMLDTAGNRLPAKIKQSILLIRALLGKRRLLLLEEPFLHLEETEKNKIMEFILKNSSATTILTTTDFNIAKACDQVIVIENGVIVNQGSSKNVAASLIK
ncbi:MAG: ATP-binding cassette domain-containing protein [Bacteroidetes bacterium]|nr:ATP-binding cassette domain-containing protein [Bacteroidota bacterium]